MSGASEHIEHDGKTYVPLPYLHMAHETCARLTAERDALRSDVERLTKDRDIALNVRDRAREASNRDLEAKRVAEGQSDLESRVAEWIRTRIGESHMHPRERAMRLLEEAAELAQAEGVTVEQADAQIQHVFSRDPGDPAQEAGGVAVCLLGWCAATGNRLHDVALAEVRRIEAKPVEDIRGSLARKMDADLVTAVPEERP